MSYPIMTRRLYDEFVELIKRAERDSLDSYCQPGKKVQIWLRSDPERDKTKLEYYVRPKKLPFENDDGTYWPAVEIYRAKPHNLKSLYSKTKRWKNAIDWNDECFGDSAAYAELVEYHINNRRSKFDIPGIIKNAYEKCMINGIADNPEIYWSDNENENLEYEDELVDCTGKSANDYGYEDDDDDY